MNIKIKLNTVLVYVVSSLISVLKASYSYAVVFCALAIIMYSFCGINSDVFNLWWSFVYISFKILFTINAT